MQKLKSDGDFIQLRPNDCDHWSLRWRYVKLFPKQRGCLPLNQRGWRNDWCSWRSQSVAYKLPESRIKSMICNCFCNWQDTLSQTSIYLFLQCTTVLFIELNLTLPQSLPLAIPTCTCFRHPQPPIVPTINKKNKGINKYDMSRSGCGLFLSSISFLGLRNRKIMALPKRKKCKERWIINGKKTNNLDWSLINETRIQ